MYVDTDLIIKAGAVLTAALAIGTAIWRVIRWVQRQKEQDDAIDAIKKEQCLLTYGVLACLKGLAEQGCDGPVTDAINKIEKHINEQAHDQIRKEGAA